LKFTVAKLVNVPSPLKVRNRIAAFGAAPAEVMKYPAELTLYSPLKVVKLHERCFARAG
jgi:hypothetical protein